LLCSTLLLSGEVLVETPDGKQHRINPQRGLLSRIRDSGTRFILPGGQTIRHAGVTSNIPALHERLGNPLPGALACFSILPASGVVCCPIPVQNRLRNLMANLFSPLSGSDGALQEIALQGASLSIQAEVMRTLLATHGTLEGKTPRWGEQVLDDLTAYIHEHLALPLKSDDIGKKFGLSKRQLQQLFLARAQCTPGEYLRRQRLTRARELIEKEGLAVKEAAHAVGYNHASNFTKAYRNFFGETPGQTQRLSKALTTETMTPG